ncbi:MAG: hypothetical protein RR374_06125 [Clostridia bacterium]
MDINNEETQNNLPNFGLDSYKINPNYAIYNMALFGSELFFMELGKLIYKRISKK